MCSDSGVTKVPAQLSRNYLTRLLAGVQIAGKMLSLILRSVWVGIATAAAAIFLTLFVGLPVTLMILSNSRGSSGRGEFGWDVVALGHSYQDIIILCTLIVFAIGFLFGYRYFSRSLAKK
jgi:hypothetical protein